MPCKSFRGSARATSTTTNANGSLILNLFGKIPTTTNYTQRGIILLLFFYLYPRRYKNEKKSSFIPEKV
jgi:hypothetical protein